MSKTTKLTLSSKVCNYISRKRSASSCDEARSKDKDVVNRSSLTLSSSMNDDGGAVELHPLNNVKLIPVDCSFQAVTEQKKCAILLPDMLRKHRKGNGSRNVTVVFVIRHPGCGGCREHGVQLTELYATENIDCIGIVKETSPDVHEALLEFYQDYFRFPLYRDEKWLLYEELGNRRLSTWQLLASNPKLTRRFKKNNMKTKAFGGDCFTQGGILIFDKKRNLRFTYRENFGELLDMDTLRQAIQAARQPVIEKGAQIWEIDESTQFDASEN